MATAPKKATQATMLREKGYITASEAAEKSGMTVYTMYRWVQEEKVKGIKVGKHWFVLAESLVEYLGADAAAALGMTNKKGEAVL